MAVGINTGAVVCSAVPGVAVVGGHHRVRMHRVVDGEVQRHRGIAAVNGVEMLDVVTRLDIDGVVPGEGLAGGFAPDDGGVVVEGEVEGDDGVAAHGVGERHRRGVCALRVGHPVNPGEAVAGGLDIGVVGRLLDRQVQCGDAVAARYRCRSRVRHYGVHARGELEAEAVVIHAGTDAVENVGVQYRVDNHVHRQHTVGTRRGCQRHRAVARRIECDTVPHYRQVVFANDAVHRVADIAVDRQDEGDDGVAAVGVGDGLCISARLTVQRVVELVRQVVLVHGHLKGAVRAEVQGQVQCHHRVAACRVGEHHCRGARALRVGHPVNPSEAVAGGLDIGMVGRLLDRQVQRGDAVAARHRC